MGLLVPRFDGDTALYLCLSMAAGALVVPGRQVEMGESPTNVRLDMGETFAASGKQQEVGRTRTHAAAPSASGANHLALPAPLCPVVLPASSADERDGHVKLVHRRTAPPREEQIPEGDLTPKQATCSLCGFLMMPARWRRSAAQQRTDRLSHGHSDSSKHDSDTQPGGLATNLERALWTTKPGNRNVQVQFDPAPAMTAGAGKMQNGEPGGSPMLRGLARSPFVDGLKSASRDGPGRLVRGLTGGRSSALAGDDKLAFSVHA